MALLREYKEIAYQWGIWKTEESPEELLALLPDPERYEQQLTLFLHLIVNWNGFPYVYCYISCWGGKDN